MYTQDSNPFLLFDFIDPTTGEKKPHCFTNPFEIIVAQTVKDVEECLIKVQTAVESGYYAAGYLSYEAAPAFDLAFKVHSHHKMPLLWFGLFHQPCSLHPFPAGTGDYKVGEWHPAVNYGTYQEGISRIKKAISQGETYQVNYTMQLKSTFSGDDFAFYKKLRQAQSTHYSAYLNLGKYRILSLSPELYFHWHNNEIITRPMKGTIKRGRWREEDRAHATWLLNSEKNRAENLMIVDLLRNDLGTIAETGSVKVKSLLDIEPYPTVFQMTSTITAKPKASVHLLEIFKALFPCGSITGAPKISTMNLISEIEMTPREVYCGAIGFISPESGATFNVPIRTVVIDKENEEASFGVGGGVTWDSTVLDEYNEVLTKAKFLTAESQNFQLLESIRLENGTYDLLEQHLQRLKASAEYFAFNIDIEIVEQKLQAYAEEYSNSVQKVRLQVFQDGSIEVAGAPLSRPSNSLITLASEPIDPENLFLYHKTTHRLFYEEQRSKHPGIFDVLLWNDKDELTEFTNGNLVLEFPRGLFLTPPIESGLLGGTLRAALLHDGKITEQKLTKADLHSCKQIWFINSVRGWIPVEMIKD